ncbi:MAG TPA: hypothetical protein VI216_15255 [Candidatus Acidoferrales bacterium]
MRIRSWKHGSAIVFAALVAVVLLLGGKTAFAQAQTQPYGYQERGFTAYEDIRASDSNFGQFLIFDTSFGYQFNNHIGADVGVPVYLVRPTFPGQPHQWDYNIGDPYGDLRLTFNNNILNYDTAFTVSVPANETGQFSTGRMGLDWFNHFDHPVWRFTPFVNAGLANGVLDTRLLSQPFRLADSFKTLGFLADVEGGMNFRVIRYVSVGGSYYELFPGGDQKVYNGVTNFFLAPPPGETISDVTHDRGYSSWVRLMAGRTFYIEAAYVHSIKLNNDAGTVTLGVDLKSLFTRPAALQH